jgi:hypothetical protein
VSLDAALPVARAGCVAERVGVREQQPRVLAPGTDLFGAAGGLADEQRAFEELQRDILSVRGLRQEIAPPREEAIDPGDDRIFVPADRIDIEDPHHSSVPVQRASLASRNRA